MKTLISAGGSPSNPSSPWLRVITATLLLGLANGVSVFLQGRQETEVVVRTRKVGHFFPGGTVDAFDVWVEFEAVDDQGRVLLHSGAAADGGSGPGAGRGLGLRTGSEPIHPF